MDKTFDKHNQILVFVRTTIVKRKGGAFNNSDSGNGTAGQAGGFVLNNLFLNIVIIIFKIKVVNI